MDLLQRAKELEESAGGGWLSAEGAKTLASEFGLAIDQLLLDLIPLASTYALPSQSGFRAAATAQGDSGAIYFGANIEILGCSLSEAVHAEQAIVVNAAAHGETGLARLAASAPPCGYCRQFLFELATADRLKILLVDTPPTKLTEYLPRAFGPAELSAAGGLLSQQKQNLEWLSSPHPNDQTSASAFQAAATSYAPYTRAFAGAAVTTRTGQTYAGSYLENAAFNPSLSPLQAALVRARFGGASFEDIVEVALVQIENAKIDHAAAAQLMLAKVSPSATIQIHQVRVA